MKEEKLSNLYEPIYRLTFHDDYDLDSKQVIYTTGTFDDVVALAKKIENDEKNVFNDCRELVYIEKIEKLVDGFFVDMEKAL